MIFYFAVYNSDMREEMKRGPSRLLRLDTMMLTPSFVEGSSLPDLAKATHLLLFRRPRFAQWVIFVV